jgi:hypothetical protein
VAAKPSGRIGGDGRRGVRGAGRRKIIKIGDGKNDAHNGSGAGAASAGAASKINGMASKSGMAHQQRRKISKSESIIMKIAKIMAKGGGESI